MRQLVRALTGHSLGTALIIVVGSAAAQPIEQPGPFAEQVRGLGGHKGGLTPDTVAERAVATSYPIRAQGHALNAARAEANKAELGYVPKLTLLARYKRLSNVDAPQLGRLVAAPGAPEGPLAPGTPLVNVPVTFPTVLDQYLLQANLTVPLSDYFLRVPHAVNSASHAERAVAGQVTVESADVQLRSYLAYYAWVRARLRGVAAEHNLNQIRMHREAVKARVELGGTARAELLAADARVARAELLSERAKTALTMAEDQLRTLMHDTSRKSYEIGIELDPPADDRIDSVVQLVAEARRNRSELDILRAQESSISAQARGAKAGTLPRLDAFGNVYFANPNPHFVPPRDRFETTWDAGLQLTITLNDVLTTSPTVSALNARHAEALARRRSLEDAIRTEIVEARLNLLQARAALSAADRAVAAAEEAHRAQSELYAFGRTTNLAVVDAEVELLEARLEWINALVDLRVARAQLDHAVGRRPHRG